MKSYNEDYKKNIVRLHIEESRTIKSLAEEYNVSKAIISIWTKKYREECQVKPKIKEEYDAMMVNKQLRQELKEKEKEIAFFKKAVHILREGNRLTVYRFIDDNKKEFGVRWLLTKLSIYPNSYYNYLKNRKRRKL